MFRPNSGGKGLACLALCFAALLQVPPLRRTSVDRVISRLTTGYDKVGVALAVQPGRHRDKRTQYLHKAHPLIE